MIVAENSSFWPRFPTSLSTREVHVWRLKLEQSELQVDEFAPILSGDERRRAARFRFERDRKRFVVGRGVLRTILASYMNTEPDQLKFSYGAYGKPYVQHRSYGIPIQFSIAHSHELALYAFARERKVGVDAEYVREFPDLEQMGARYLTEQENAVFKSLPRRQKARAFFESWTRKEAYLKAIGTGLAHALDRIDVVRAGELTPVPNTRDLVGTSELSIASFTPCLGYVAALAIEGGNLSLRRISSPVVFNFSQPRSPSLAEPVLQNSDQVTSVGVCDRKSADGRFGYPRSSRP